MKVTFVVDGLQIGGIERVCCDYSKLFLNLGWEVNVINLRPNLRELESEFPSKCSIYHVNYSRRLAPEQYAQFIKRYAVGRYIYPIVFAVLSIINVIYKPFLKLTHKELRDKQDLVIAFSSHFNDLTFVSDNYVSSKHKMCWLHGALYGYLLISDGFINLYNKIKNLVVLVDDAQEEVLTTNKQLHLNIHKLYNPTFISNRSVDEHRVNELKEKYGKYLLMVSRFEYPHKDQFTVVKAFQILRNKYLDNVDLVFVGDGPDQERVVEEANSLGGISKHIHFEGARMDVQNYYSSATVLVHASVAGEGLPTVQLEAMAYDLPQVVTDSKVGPREILEDNKYGLLCKVQDPEDMAEKIHMLLNDDTLYSNYQIVGKERLKDFLPDTIQSKLKDIVNEVINQ